MWEIRVHGHLLPRVEGWKAAEFPPLDVGGKAVVPAPLEVQGHQVHAGRVVALEEVLGQLKIYVLRLLAVLTIRRVVYGLFLTVALVKSCSDSLAGSDSFQTSIF